MDRIKYLILASLRGELSTEEQVEFNQWVSADESRRALMDSMTDPKQIAQALSKLSEYNKERIWEKIQGGRHSKVVPVHRVHFLRRIRWAAAAILLFVLGATTIWLINQDDKISGTALYADVAPGKEGAKLKLSDGRVIMIDSLKDGLIARDGNVLVYKENGQIVYKGEATEQVIYNEIITDRGRQWSAQLPDGSTVWLNAASSLRYPLQFNGKERLVTMTGEASFRVVHNDKQPFRVSVRNQIVEDIGTEFNINAYEDEPAILTTLIEGSASVQLNQQKVLLVQGEQAKVTAGSDNIEKESGIDTDQVIAWRLGKFKFGGADIRSVMRQISRWYDVDVEFQGEFSDDSFVGGTIRNQQLSEVLKTLEVNGGVHFTIEGKKVIVRP
jgi:transmembrane sensor